MDSYSEKESLHGEEQDSGYLSSAGTLIFLLLTVLTTGVISSWGTSLYYKRQVFLTCVEHIGTPKRCIEFTNRLDPWTTGTKKSSTK